MLGAGHPDTDAAIAELEANGSLTPGLNYYRANIPPERFLPSGGVQPPPIQAPTMGVWSSGDFALTEGQMTRSAEHVAGPWRYERLDGPGHWMQIEAPDEVNRLLLDFLPAAAVGASGGWPRIVVLGGGVCGLLGGMMLARDGHEVTVLERDAAPVPESLEEAWESWSREGVTQFRLAHFLQPGVAWCWRRRSPTSLRGSSRRGAMRLDLLGLISPPSPTGAARGPAMSGS